MALPNSGIHIDRLPVSGVGFTTASEFVKMFDPPTESPPLPEAINVGLLPLSLADNPRANPVPEVMAAAFPGVFSPATPHTRTFDLLNGLDLTTWDQAKVIHFMCVRDKDSPLGGTYPGPICRMPRAVIFHGDLSGKGPPPHTIHWHGIEPTPINDGVGHCSMEIGSYTYQYQPNFIGTYFYHCHRNTVQHFEFGLFSMLPIEPPDAYFASIASVIADPNDARRIIGVTLNNIPVGACLDGKFRTAANLLTLPQAIQDKFPGFVAGDSVFGVGNATDDGVGHPHAFTVDYDVEVIWVPDDRDSRWSDLASNAFATFPKHGSIPGVNDQFHENPTNQGFFAFNDYHADYWFITGVPVPARLGGTAVINPALPPPRGGIGGIPVADGLIPAIVNSGKGMRGTVQEPGLQSQIAVNARVGQNIFVRCLNAAYNNIRVTFPVDVIIIEWDGRALGVPPFCTNVNHAYVVPAGTPTTFSVARRFGALIKAEATMNSFAKVEYLDTRGSTVNATALIPFNIAP